MTQPNDNALARLRRETTVVADTGDLEALTRFQPEDATTNPSLILKAVQSGQFDDELNALAASGARNDLSTELLVAMADRVAQRVPGRVSIEVDARHSFDVLASVKQAWRIVAGCERNGLGTDRLYIKLAATWEGIRAARELERDGIPCNLTLVFSQVQALACAEAGVSLISPFVGRVLDWHRRQFPENTRATGATEPGVRLVRSIVRRFRQSGHSTLVMAASFRNVEEIWALRDCDKLTISPALLTQLANLDAEALDTPQASDPVDAPVDWVSPVEQSDFRWALSGDRMATELLHGGIQQFHADNLCLHSLLKERPESTM